MRHRLLFALAVGFAGLAAVASAEELRTWSDATGKFKIEAKFVSQDKGKVTLEKADGSQFEIPLAKLSAADKKYVAEYKEPEDDPFQPKKVAPMPMPMPKVKGKAKVEDDADLTAFDTTDMKVVPILPVGDGWKLELPKFELPKLAARGIALPAKSDFWEKTSGVAVNSTGTRAVVGLMMQKPGNNDEGTARFILADLETGKPTVTPSVESPLILMAVADNGTDVLVKKSQWGWSKPGRVEVLSLAAGGVKRGVAWTPHADESWEPNRGVHWAGFVADGKVATLSEGGTLIVWDTEAKKALYSVATGTKSTPAVAPGGKMLALVTKRDVFVLDAATGDILAMKSAGNSPPSAVAFSPSAARMAVVTAAGLVVWETTTGEVYREVPTAFGAGAPVFVGEDRVLVGGNLYDLETKTALWTYMGGEMPFSAGGTTWFTASEHNSVGALVPLKLPHPAALEVLRQSVEDPNFYVLKPGSTVKLDLAQIPEDAREKVQKELTARLEANDMKVGDDGAVTLTAWTEAGKEREVNYRSFGGPFGGPPIPFGGPGGPFANGKTYKVKEHFSKLRLSLDDKSIYELSAGGIPHIINLKEGDTVEKVLKTYEKPNYDHFATFVLPKRLSKTQGNRPTLGLSQITTSGVR